MNPSEKTNPSIMKSATLLMDSLGLQYFTEAQVKFFLLHPETARIMKEQYWIR